MEYISERICNISELERLIQSAYHGISDLRDEMEKESPSMAKIDELSKQIHSELLQAKDFEFLIEYRRTKGPEFEKSPEEIIREVFHPDCQCFRHTELNVSSAVKHLHEFLKRRPE